MVSDSSATYAYDYANRLSQITNINGITNYIYDDSTNRIQKRLANGARLSYIGNEMETDEAGKATDYIFANNDRILTIDPNEGVLYNIEDHLSSASLIVKGGASPTIIQKLDYYPYGTERVNEKTTAFGARHTFTDKELDTESGLQYFGARYYNPTIGRFTSVDPVTLAIGNEAKVKELTQQELQQVLSDPQNLNSHAYARNNPLKYTDPKGEWFETAFDVAMFGFSLNDFRREHSFWNGVSVAADGASILLPIPAVVGGIRHADDAAKFFKGVDKVADGEKVINNVGDYTRRFGQNLGQKMNKITANLKNSGYKFSDHSIQRIAEKIGVGNEQSVINVLKNSKPFEYFHDGINKTGFYDNVSKIFVGQVKDTGNITTVITNVPEKYIKNLTK